MKYVNDDYCDCVGSGDDEPGTSACNHGKFWCTNLGYRGRHIYSSSVNDGICDCCDGSDELNNDRIKCENVCSVKAKEELAEFIQQKKKYMEGIKVKNSLLQVAKSKLNEKVSRKTEIEQQLKAKKEETKSKEDLKKIAEDKERAYKDEKKQKDDIERAKKRESEIEQCKADGKDNCDVPEVEDDSAEVKSS